MAVNFPSNPTNGQTITAAGSPTLTTLRRAFGLITHRFDSGYRRAYRRGYVYNASSGRLVAVERF